MKGKKKGKDKMNLSTKCIVENILPLHDDGYDLHDTFDWYTRAFQERTGIRCEAKCQLQSRIAGGRQVAAIFQIFEEILINIARHAAATKVCVSLGYHAGIMILRVMDNGRGIAGDCLYSNGSRGLTGMREYARLCGGEFRINSGLEKGTTIVVSIPVKQDEVRENRIKDSGGVSRE
jgi:signal transduction histidine kinase